MRNNRLKDILIHPAFISFILWLVVIILLPPLFPRYRVKQISEKPHPIGEGFIYSDLDSDGNSEEISMDLNDKYRTKIIVSRNNRVLDQHNIRFQPIDINYVFIEDYNHDGYKEIYVFTVNNDSILLSIVDPVLSRKIILADRFIDIWRKGPYTESGPYIKVVGVLENPDNSNCDLIFFISTGFSLQPRNVYRYNIEEDSLIKSPRSGATISDCILADITDDGLPEILLDVQATGNQPDTFPFTDRYSWVMVLKNDLSFLFPPVNICQEPSKSFILPVKQKNETGLIVYKNYFGSENLPSAFCLFNNRGSEIRQNPIRESDNDFFRDIAHAYNRIFPARDHNMNAFYFLKNYNTDIVLMDTAFMPVKNIRMPAIQENQPYVLDADMDGQKEYIFRGAGNKNLVIVKENFRDAVTFPTDIASTLKYPLKISSVYKKGAKPQVYLQFQELGMFIQYSGNPLFHFRYLIYFVIYLIIFAFIALISRIQQYRLTQKQLTGRKIASLQMKAIKNQIDPHFTLNVLNAIGSLYATEKNREKADYIFGKYARLIRETVVSSDKIIVTLAEELDFVNNYLEIEQFRSDYSFDYNVNISKGIDTNMKIPRMLVHTFVENAIKYGVKARNNDGLLKIEVNKIGHKCRIMVEDNGPGIDTAKMPQSGTGKGLTILDELIDLYFRLEKSKITYSLENITGEGNTITGTKALIELYC